MMNELQINACIAEILKRNHDDIIDWSYRNSGIYLQQTIEIEEEKEKAWVHFDLFKDAQSLKSVLEYFKPSFRYDGDWVASLAKNIIRDKTLELALGRIIVITWLELEELEKIKEMCNKWTQNKK